MKKNNKDRLDIINDLRKYKKDSLSYTLTIIGLIFNVIYFFALYKNNHTYFYSYKIGISIIYNLLFLLFVFLSAEEIKYYKRKYAIVLIAISIMQFIRIFIYPLDSINNEAIDQSCFNALRIYLLISGLLLSTGGIISFMRCTSLKNYLLNGQNKALNSIKK